MASEQSHNGDAAYMENDIVDTDNNDDDGTDDDTDDDHDQSRTHRHAAAVPIATTNSYSHAENEDDSEDEMGSNNTNNYYNLDPSVLALLERLPPHASEAQVHNRIALIKLQQATIVGHSKFAARVLDSAMQEATRDKQAHGMLQARMQELQTELTRRQQRQQQTLTTTQNSDNNATVSSTPAVSTTNSNETDNASMGTANASDDAFQKAEMERLSLELQAAQIQSNTWQDTLYKQLEQDLIWIQQEQSALYKQQTRLSIRVQQIQRVIRQQQQPTTQINERYDKLCQKLETVMKERKKYLRLDNNSAWPAGRCVICHDRDAAVAVIPCGHLCLCESCIEIMVQQHQQSPNQQQQQCPVCRGMLLSSIKIYTPTSAV